MIKIQRRITGKTPLAVEDLRKASLSESSYNTENVNLALKEVFYGKCYICEIKRQHLIR